MIVNYLSLFVGLLYIAMGIFVFVRKTFAIPLEDTTAMGLGVVLVIYGVFRIVRAIIRLKRKNEI